MARRTALEIWTIGRNPVGQLLETIAVLRVHWQIEAERVAELCDLAGGGAFAEHLLDGIAGHDVDHQEDECENEPKGGGG